MEQGAVRLPRIPVLTICCLAQWRVVQEEAQTEEDWSRSDVEDLINEVRLRLL